MKDKAFCILSFNKPGGCLLRALLNAGPWDRENTCWVFPPADTVRQGQAALNKATWFCKGAQQLP